MYFNLPKLRLAIALMSFVVLGAGCAAEPFFVVLRDVPESPSFVVIPANEYLHEVEFANLVESSLLGANVKVVMRPGTKEVRTEETVQGAEGKQAQGVQSRRQADVKLIESYLQFEEIDADYIVRTYVNSGQVRIAKKETREILAVFGFFPLEDYASKSNRIHKALAKMGIPAVSYQRK